MHELKMTDAQALAIAAQVAVYATPAAPCAGLASFRVQPAENADGEPDPNGAVDVRFDYVHEDGQTPGHEVTTFDREGNVTTSQDYG